ncbi:asparagine synthase (glutamine-hydrolysing) [Pseudomonas brassicacearum]|nr:asparagine synthase (glutamine-hydrolysing) [Pseudomonas brassicacearum]
MCGLAGELRFDQQPADLAAVERITHHLAPRGPDAWGFHSQGPIALGHRRLKIMDLSDGSAQPMIDNQLGLSLAFNGAIYNYPELRSELEGLGYSFYSGATPEVLLKGYHAWGEALLPKLNGMFAFAIWGTRCQAAVHRPRPPRRQAAVPVAHRPTATFRLGIASTAQGWRYQPDARPGGPQPLPEFPRGGPAPRTLLAGVEKLPPATWMRIEADGSTEQKTWWTLPYGPRADEQHLNLEDWIDRVLDSTREAVAIRQRAAVDVGVLLSGGVDSSMLVGLLREVGVEDLSTFSIGFQDAGGERGDEFQYSDLIAKHYGTRHHQLRIDEKEIIEQLPAAFRAMSEPMVSHDCIAFYLLSREVAKHCKVVQSGQGADELFAGYHWYPQVDGASDPYAAYRAAFFDRSYEEYAATVQPKWLMANDAAGDFVKETFRPARGRCGGRQGPAPGQHRDAGGRPGQACRQHDHGLGPGSAHALPGLPPGGTLGPGPSEVQAARWRQAGTQGSRPAGDPRRGDRPQEGYFPVPGLKHLEGNTLAWVRELLLDPSQDRGLFNPAMLDRLLTDPTASSRHCAARDCANWRR